MNKCETCVYYDTDRNDQPCCGCCGGVNYEEVDDNERQADRVVGKL
jgi:hypothetical protein